MQSSSIEGLRLTPNVYLSVEDFDAAFTAHSPTTSDMISFSCAEVSLALGFHDIPYPAHHVESICH
jgi:hypothetical protein